jgi:hypothetical protein
MVGHQQPGFQREKFESICCSAQGIRNLYFNPSGDPIQSKEHIKDLGVTFSFDATFSRHSDIITAKAHKLSGWLRSFKCREKDLMLPLLRQLIILTVEYCCPVWSSGHVTNVDKLEKIQRSFTKKIAGLWNTNYWDRLA